MDEVDEEEMACSATGGGKNQSFGGYGDKNSGRCESTEMEEKGSFIASRVQPLGS